MRIYMNKAGNARLHRASISNKRYIYYAQNENLRKFPKLLKRRAQKITRKTRLLKISKSCQVGGDTKYPIGGHK